MNRNSQPNQGTEISLQDRMKAVLGNSDVTKATEQAEEATEERQEAPVDNEVEEEFAESEYEAEDVEYEDDVEDADYVEDESSEELEDSPMETYKVKPNGEEIEVTLEELQSGYMMESDYRKKTTELSEQRGRLAEETAEVDKARVEYAEKLEHLLNLTASQVPTKEQLDELLANNDTQGYLEAKRKAEEATGIWQELEKAKQETNALREKERSEAIANCQKTLKDTMPELMTEEGSNKLIGYLNGKGITSDKLQNIIDPVSYELAEKARRYDEMMGKANLKKKKVNRVPKVGTRQTSIKAKSPASQTRLNKAKQKLRKTGSRTDAQTALRAMFGAKTK